MAGGDPLTALFFVIVNFFLILYSLAYDAWVKTDTETWGNVWHTVRNHETGKLISANFLPAGSTPGYYEAVRALWGIFHLMLIPLLTAKMMPAFVGVPFILFYLVSALSPPLLLLTHYKDDERWKDSDPSFGVTFWLHWAALVLHLPLIVCTVYSYHSEQNLGRCDGLSCRRCKGTIGACCSRCVDGVSACCSRCVDGVSACCSRCIDSMRACCSRCVDCVSACCTRCVDSIRACCTRCKKGVVMCGKRCTEGISGCCRRLRDQVRLSFICVTGTLAACCAPCRRETDKTDRSETDKTDRQGKGKAAGMKHTGAQLRIVLSKDQVFTLLNELAARKAADEKQERGGRVHDEKQERDGRVHDEKQELGGRVHDEKQDAAGCNQGVWTVSLHGGWFAGHNPTLEPNLWHTACSTKQQWEQKAVEGHWNREENTIRKGSLGRLAGSTKPEEERRGLWNREIPMAKLGWDNGNRMGQWPYSTKPEWDRRSNKDHWNREKHPKPEWDNGSRIGKRQNGTKPEWDNRSNNFFWNREQNPKPEWENGNRMGQRPYGTKPEWDRRRNEDYWHREQNPRPECENGHWNGEQQSKPEGDNGNRMGQRPYDTKPEWDRRRKEDYWHRELTPRREWYHGHWNRENHPKPEWDNGSMAPKRSGTEEAMKAPGTQMGISNRKGTCGTQGGSLWSDPSCYLAGPAPYNHVPDTPV